MKLAILFFLTSNAFGQLNVKLDELSLKFQDTERPLSKGWVNYQTDDLDQFVGFSYYSTERISVCRYPDGIVVNGLMYELPKPVKNLTVIIEQNKLVVSGPEPLKSKGLIMKKHVPAGFAKHQCRFPFGVDGKMVNIEVFGYLASGSSTNSDEHTNLAKDKIVISLGSVILSFQKGVASLWNKEIGPCKESLKIDQEMKEVTLDGRIISFEELGVGE
jgi:hypothetical protein